MQYKWVEDDRDLPVGVIRLGESAPEFGREYIMYHGTTRWAAQSILAFGFRQSTDGMLGCGIYLSRDLDKASRYPIGHPESDKVVIKVVVNVGNVIAINYQGHPLQKSWPYFGYNTAWVPPGCGIVERGFEEMCVWDPRRIRVIGTNLPRPVLSSPNPRYSEGSAYGNTDTDSGMQYEWAEDDFELPAGVIRLGESAPEFDKEYVMYHGTTREAAKSIVDNASGFRQSADGMLGCGVYLSRDLNKASRYPIDHPESDKVVIKVKVKVGKVIAINYQGHPLQKKWHDFGYDTAWVPPRCGMVKSGLEEDCVWDPNRIQIIGTIKPRPVQPQPVQPQPVQPQPVQPHPVQPHPVQPHPVQPHPVYSFPVPGFFVGGAYG